MANRKSRWLVTLFLVLALVLAACSSATPTPTTAPTEAPTDEPTEVVDAQAVEDATEEATDVPTEEPTEVPTEEPTEVPTEEPTDVPTMEATEEATMEVTEEATMEATEEATMEATEEATMEATEEAVVEMGRIYDIVQDANNADEPEFTILAAAIRNADSAVLAAVTDASSTLTVFAPTDAAFAAAFEAMGVTEKDVLADHDMLTQILLYHVLGEVVTAEDIVGMDGATVETLNGATIDVTVGEDGGVVLNGTVNVVTADIMASNGVIHVIDGVLMPPMPEEPVEEPTEEAPAELKSILATARDNEDLSFWIAAVGVSSLPAKLDADGTYTVFIPTNEAFKAALESLDMNLLQFISADDLRESILNYHVLETVAMAEDVMGMDGEEVTTLNGAPLKITVTDDGVVLNDTVNVITTDIAASNGVIHIIDAVLVPPMEEMMEEATEEATVEPTEVPTEEAVEEPTEVAEELPTILDIAHGKDFSTLYILLNDTGLAGTFSGEGTFTVFAPTNAAFKATLGELGLSTLDLLGNNELTTSILTYHVLDSVVMAEDVMGMDGEEVTTLNGATIKISVTDSGVVLNDTVNVTMTDIEASNGIVHVIDAVLIPPTGE